MEAKKYTVGTTGPKIETFLRSIAKSGGFQLKWVIEAAQAMHPDIENPDVVGISIRQDWAALEPSEGNFDWSFLDAQVGRAAAYGKVILLRINSPWRCCA